MFFDTGVFGNYFFRTGTTTFLIYILKRRSQIRSVFETLKVGSSFFDSYDPLAIDETPLLFQTGYLTFKEVDLSLMSPLYVIGAPNEEVKISFLEHLIYAYSKYSSGRIEILVSNMQHQIQSKDGQEFSKSLRMLFANIPYKLHVKHESYYHSIFLAMMKLLGFDIHYERMMNIGCIDVVWRQSNVTVVAEIKFSVRKKIDTLLYEAI
jgi:hypothetical protein